MTISLIVITVFVVFVVLVVILKVFHRLLVNRASDNLKSPYPIDRWLAAALLGRLRAAKAVPILTTSLKDCGPHVRKCSVIALGQIRDSQSVTEVMDLLRDVNWLVREAAVNTLGNIGDSSVIDTLQQGTSEGELAIREVKQIALTKIKNNQKLSGRLRLVALRKIVLPFWGLFSVPFEYIKRDGLL